MVFQNGFNRRKSVWGKGIPTDSDRSGHPHRRAAVSAKGRTRPCADPPARAGAPSAGRVAPPAGASDPIVPGTAPDRHPTGSRPARPPLEDLPRSIPLPKGGCRVRPAAADGRTEWNAVPTWPTGIAGQSHSRRRAAFRPGVAADPGMGTHRAAASTRHLVRIGCGPAGLRQRGRDTVCRLWAQRCGGAGRTMLRLGNSPSYRPRLGAVLRPMRFAASRSGMPDPAVNPPQENDAVSRVGGAVGTPAGSTPPFGPELRHRHTCAAGVHGIVRGWPRRRARNSRRVGVSDPVGPSRADASQCPATLYIIIVP